MNTIPETLTHGGAWALRNKIRSYWAARDKSPDIIIEEHRLSSAPTDRDHSYFVVRSNMIGGLPI